MKISSRKKSSPVIMQSKKEIGSISFVKGSSLSSELSKIGEEVDKIEEKIGEGFRLIENNNWHKNDVPKADIQFEKHAEHTYKCTCNICGEEVHRKREKLDLRQDTVFFKNFDFETQHQNLPLEKDFVFILKRLMPTKIMTRSLYLSIPETACFIQGECKFIVSTGKVKISLFCYKDIGKNFKIHKTKRSTCFA